MTSDVPQPIAQALSTLARTPASDRSVDATLGATVGAVDRRDHGALPADAVAWTDADRGQTRPGEPPP
jgi:hypothetical protein